MSTHLPTSKQKNQREKQSQSQEQSLIRKESDASLCYLLPLILKGFTNNFQLKKFNKD